MLISGASLVRCILRQKRPVFGSRLAHLHLSGTRPLYFSTNHDPADAGRPCSTIKNQAGSLLSSFPYLPFTTRPAVSSEEQKVQVLPEPTHPEKLLNQNKKFWDLPSKLVSPVLQIFSIAIQNNSLIDPLLKIYGSIEVTDNQGTSSVLYSQNHRKPDVITNRGNLSLIDTQFSFITRSLDTNTTLEIDLIDQVRNVNVIKEKLVLHSKTEDLEESCDKLLTLPVLGPSSVAAYVYYTVFRFAVLADVTVIISEKYDANASADSRLYGSIVAEYSDARRYVKNDDDVKYMKTTLFHQEPNNAVLTDVGDPIRLSRCVVAVPAYSSLKIEADLWDRQGLFAHGCAEFKAHDRGDIFECFDGERAKIEVQVRWLSTFARCFIEDTGNGYIDVGGDRDTSFSPFGREDTTIRRTKPLAYGDDMTEVFSAYVTGFNHQVSALSGAIKYCKWDPLSMYQRDLNDPEILRADNPLASLVAHTPIDSTWIAMFVDLWDPVQDLHLGRGSVKYGGGPHSYYDVRLCSLFPAEHGYTAVHYMFFEDGCCAHVDIKLLSHDSITFDSTATVHGTIFASYSTHDYSTAYQKKYFRSRLFDKAPVESVQLRKHSKFPLLKSVVAMPCKSSLIIEADLRLSSSSSNPEGKPLRGTASLDIDGSCISEKLIEGERSVILVRVEFFATYPIGNTRKFQNTYNWELLQRAEGWSRIV